MKYYRVKPEYDNRRKPDGDIYIKNELYTPKEVENQKLNIEFMEVVDISKKSIYWFFGARFCEKYPA